MSIAISTGLYGSVCAEPGPAAAHAVSRTAASETSAIRYTVGQIRPRPRIWPRLPRPAAASSSAARRIRCCRRDRTDSRGQAFAHETHVSEPVIRIEIGSCLVGHVEPDSGLAWLARARSVLSVPRDVLQLVIVGLPEPPTRKLDDFLGRIATHRRKIRNELRRHRFGPDSAGSSVSSHRAGKADQKVVARAGRVDGRTAVSVTDWIVGTDSDPDVIRGRPGWAEFRRHTRKRHPDDAVGFSGRNPDQKLALWTRVERARS